MHAVYARVSTDDKGQDPTNQLMQMPAHDIEFIDYASGKSGDREAFQAMMRAAAEHRFDSITFWSIDRFSREGGFNVLVYLKRLEALGIKWFSVREPYLNSENPMRDTIICLMGDIAAQERLRISERVKAGMCRAKAKGTKSGNPIGRRRAGLESQCRELRATGLTFREVARALRVSLGYVH